MLFRPLFPSLTYCDLYCPRNRSCDCVIRANIIKSTFTMPHYIHSQTNVCTHRLWYSLGYVVGDVWSINIVLVAVHLRCWRQGIRYHRCRYHKRVYRSDRKGGIDCPLRRQEVTQTSVPIPLSLWLCVLVFNVIAGTLINQSDRVLVSQCPFLLITHGIIRRLVLVLANKTHSPSIYWICQRLKIPKLMSLFVLAM